ncbi:MAG: amino acid ABC transporter substrate-binding protein [Ectothiorhodospiraceae bacterium]|nr:amino acid ABC transporter substrate-binding protein [Chromatiales bacterium]MCP5154734.1 amino acid ABC transporter substrate-binding protein [Ectothiorhodospiraceae bacterium]
MRFVPCALAAVLLAGLAGAVDAGTLDDVRARGILHCGVGGDVPGFSAVDESGRLRGMDVDFCGAVAAVVLGDATKVKFTSLTAKQRFLALQSGEIDLLARNTTWTLQRDTALALNFTGVMYYDGQGFMVRRALGVENARELAGASVCVNIGTTTVLNLGDFFRVNNMDFKQVPFESSEEAVAAYDAGRCDAYTGDRSLLAGQRLKLSEPDAHVILPDTISKEPLGPVVRHGDDQWFDIVKWTLFCLIGAEEQGLTMGSVDAATTEAKDPATRRLLGLDGDLGKDLGVSAQWCQAAVKQVGNYGEIYDRHLGPGSPIGLPRGHNAQWRDGGLHYAMPIR